MLFQLFAGLAFIAWFGTRIFSRKAMARTQWYHGNFGVVYCWSIFIWIVFSIALAIFALNTYPSDIGRVCLADKAADVYLIFTGVVVLETIYFFFIKRRYDKPDFPGDEY